MEFIILQLNFRRATRDDLSAIVKLLADDPLGARRESFTDPLPASYQAAFAAIDQDPNHELRSAGVGEQLFRWAIQRARDRGCHLVQLTSDKARPDAIRFYERLGFVSSHEGMKLHLSA